MYCDGRVTCSCLAGYPNCVCWLAHLASLLTGSTVISVVLQKQEKITLQWTNNVGTESPQGGRYFTEVVEHSHILLQSLSLLFMDAVIIVVVVDANLLFLISDVPDCSHYKNTVSHVITEDQSQAEIHAIEFTFLYMSCAPLSALSLCVLPAAYTRISYFKASTRKRKESEIHFSQKKIK